MKSSSDNCKYYKKCGSCRLRNLSYEEQLSFKMSRLIKQLGQFCHIEEIVPMEDTVGYRNKATAAFFEQGGRVYAGLYQSSSQRIVKCDGCPVQTGLANRMIKEICNIMNELHLHAYDPEKDRGFLRHVLIRQAFKTGDVMVIIVSRNAMFPKEELFVSLLTERFPQITSIVHNVNDTDTPIWMTDKERVIYGSEHITDILCGCTFSISARSFYQINPVQTAKLYSKAIELAELSGKETVLDAYSGIGTVGIISAKRAGYVHCTETNKAAVKDAIRNARLSGVSNIKFFISDSVAFLRDASSRGENYDAVFIDPPRAGCDKSFLSKLMNIAPKRIIYISCNPETLARDLAYMRAGGWRASVIQPFDMFPHTTHVECVVLLSQT